MSIISRVGPDGVIDLVPYPSPQEERDGCKMGYRYFECAEGALELSHILAANRSTQ